MECPIAASSCFAVCIFRSALLSYKFTNERQFFLYDMLENFEHNHVFYIFHVSTSLLTLQQRSVDGRNTKKKKKKHKKHRGQSKRSDGCVFCKCCPAPDMRTDCSCFPAVFVAHVLSCYTEANEFLASKTCA